MGGGLPCELSLMTRVAVLEVGLQDQRKRLDELVSELERNEFVSEKEIQTKQLEVDHIMARRISPTAALGSAPLQQGVLVTSKTPSATAAAAATEARAAAHRCSASAAAPPTAGETYT
eukprot:NODE_7265_length_451_cov_206.636364.p3 GENE.NODE_7265_length_451_cov_206.636364~~NODE_7265_length_451_cov_206.636364.p3  ORF type:complete len:118 (+),score=34.14 NODE_7265_length_451_cov_206.636364:3-356(+)